MWNDPIVEETRKLRDEYAARHDYDIHRMAEDLRRWEYQSHPGVGNAPPDPAFEADSPVTAPVQVLEDRAVFVNGSTVTTQIGYINRNQQECFGHRGVPGTDHGQVSYRLRCLVGGCGYEYGANGTDVFQRKCPRCQGGEKGLPF